MASGTAMRVVLALCCVLSTVQAESGFLVTFPERILSKSFEKICFTTHKLAERTRVTLTVSFPSSPCLVSTEVWTKFGPQQDECLEIDTHCSAELNSPTSSPVSPTSVRLQLSVEGTDLDGQPVSKNYDRNVSIRAENKKTFIQTDKHIYQPGQKVMFRAFTVTYPDLKMVAFKTIDAWITSPSGIRMQQWLNTIPQWGLLEEEFTLSSEPEMGTWQIHVQEQGGWRVNQDFSVEEYVLPKFEVVIIPPTYLYIGHEGSIPIQVCANYTYGQPVRGAVHANVTISNSSPLAPYISINNLPSLRPVITLAMDTDDAGCASLSVTALELGLSSISDPFNENLSIKANFTERGTDVTKQCEHTTCPLVSEIIRINIRGSNVFKPGLPYIGEVVVTKPDGSPVANQQVNISVTGGNIHQTITTGTNGLGRFDFTIPYDPSVTSKTVNAEIVALPSGTRTGPVQRSSLELTAWYSPSASFLGIEPILQRMSAGDSLPVKLSFTLPSGESISQIDFFYRIVSRGRILESGQQTWTSIPRARRCVGCKEVAINARQQVGTHTGSQAASLNPNPTLDVRAFQFNLSTTASMSPAGQVLLYYIRNDGEVVSASTDFEVRPTFENQVSVEFIEGREVRPNERVSIAVRAQPGSRSYCALGVVDKSVYILDDSAKLTKDKVFNPLSGYKTFTGEPSTECPSTSSQNSAPMTSKHADAAEGFSAAGIDILTDLLVETRPCVEVKNFHPGFALWPGPPGPPGPPGSSSCVGPGCSLLWSNPFQEEEVSSVEVRSFFPETWIWKSGEVNFQSSFEVREQIPHTITEWVASAFCLSSDQGLGVAESTAIRSFQPVFLSYTIPYSVVRGEKVPVAVTVFNYLTSCLSIQLSMTESTNFSIEARPSSETVQVCGKSSETVEYEIIPTQLGDMPVRVSASAQLSTPRGDLPPDDIVFPVNDTIEDTILVKSEGAKREETFSELICPSDNDGDQFQATVYLRLPILFAPGSGRGIIQVIGDLMGPVMTNLDNLLEMPRGCGEQNMIRMAPNIYVLQYLSHTDQLTNDLRRDAIKYMQAGYQRELHWQLSDGSYSVWGQKDGVGSTWLTAFVLKCFTQAQDFMAIDESDLAKTRRWLESNQRDSHGCVIKQGRILHKEMQGAISSPVTLTAYVTISLVEAGASASDPQVISGLDCLRFSLSTTGLRNTDTYSLAISSYAFGLGEDYTSQAYTLFVLGERKIGNDRIFHWSKSATESSGGTTCISHCRAPPADVEITSYALLSFLQQNLDSGDIVAEVMPIVKWLNKQRNALGGFSSTQDTVLGLQALAAFAKLAYSPSSSLSLSISVNATSSSSATHNLHNFDVTGTNRLVLQQDDLTEVPTELAITATGAGCALFQAELRYNVPVLSTSSRFFRTSVYVWRSRRDAQTISATNPAVCGDKSMRICVRYTGSGWETNMAVLEVEMVSGYSPEEDALNDFLTTDGARLGLSRIDKYEKGKPLAFYFDRLDISRRCVTINLRQDTIIKDTKEAVIKVYDYYNPEIVAFKSYNTC